MVWGATPPTRRVAVAARAAARQKTPGPRARPSWGQGPGAPALAAPGRSPEQTPSCGYVGHVHARAPGSGARRIAAEPTLAPGAGGAPLARPAPPRAVPPPAPWGNPRPPLAHRQPSARQAALAAVTRQRPLRLHRLQGPGHVSPVFVPAPGHLDHPPDFLLPRAVADPHREQFAGIAPVRLCAPPAAFALDTGSGHREVVDARRAQRAMEPEPLASRLIAPIPARLFRPAQAFLGTSEPSPSASRVRARLVRRRGAPATPVLKPSCHAVQPNSKAR
jgi:hypothetical protein